MNKIGLITLHNYNYGSALQCYATQQTVKRLYGSCDLIVEKNNSPKMLSLAKRGASLAQLCLLNPFQTKSIFRIFKSNRAGSLKLTNESLTEIKRFVRNYINKCAYSEEELKKAAYGDEYRAFLSGSDQVWNGARIDGYDLYFLRFAPPEKRIAWAPSFGGDTISSYNKKKYAKYISEFRLLSAREESGARIIEEITGNLVPVLPDPVMLFSGEEWRKEYENRCGFSEKNYILLFFIDNPTDRALKQIKRIQETTGKNVFSFGYRYDAFSQVPGYRHIDGSPWDFLSAIDHADAVLTDSYHATAFSTLMHTPFYVFERNYTHNQNQSTRVTSLLKNLHMENRFESETILLTNDFSSVDSYFACEHEKAFKYLEEALGKPLQNNMESINLFEHKAECCGCGACFSVCSQTAIKMECGDKGTIYPRVDETKCIRCGACTRVCPLKKKQEKNKYQKKAYIGYGKNSTLIHKSASGGIFASLAKSFIENGGIVFGAAMVKDETGHLGCRHIPVDSIENLYLIQNSKYVQSRTENIFNEVKKHIIEGKNVLFSGTSCQVAALYSFLGKNYDNLFTVDLICHGVPSAYFLDSYIKYIEKKYDGKVEDFAFRTKDYQNKETIPYVLTLTLTLADGTIIEKQIPMRDSAYYRMFMAQSGYRDSCYNCRYASTNKPADITLGDYYVDNQWLKEMDLFGEETEEHSFSSVICHSEKGSRLLSGQNDLKLYSIPVDQVAADHEQLRTASLPGVMGEKLWNMYCEGGFEKVQDYIDTRNKAVNSVKNIRRILHK